MSYPLVNIVNSTNYSANGTVHYASIFCSNDSWGAGPGLSWEANSRGVCLVTEISAYVTLPGGTVIQASSYTSSGTSYSQFALIQTSSNPPAFEVTRRVSLANEDVAPANHVEPTEKQKD
jgi:hypothetical protein